LCAVGAKEIQAILPDELSLPSDILPVNRLAIESHSTLTCCNISSVVKVVLAAAARHHVIIPNAPQVSLPRRRLSPSQFGFGLIKEYSPKMNLQHSSL
jgi:hypothetical protein